MKINTDLRDKFKPGGGACLCFHSDRHACTVIKVTRCTVTVQEDKATRIDTNGMSDDQEYSFERDPNGRIQTGHLRKNGHAYWGSVRIAPVRSHHYDYCF